MIKTKYYAGIGSRKTPSEYLEFFSKLGRYLENKGYILRSGGAKGADIAFELKVNKSNKEIYLPWHGFEGNKSTLVVEKKEAFDIAKKYHPYWNNLKQGARKLHARNSHQVLGLDLNTPSDFIICYTNKSGGTQQALRIAKDYNIPIFNCYGYKDIKECKIEFKKFISKFIEL